MGFTNRRFFFLLFGFFTLLTAWGQPNSEIKGLDLRTAGLSVYAINAEDGHVLYQTPQISLVPASVMKVITVTAALELLGADFQFHTQLGYIGTINRVDSILDGDIILKGGCDPAFYSHYFTQHYLGTFEGWADELLKKGIKTVKGDLVVDISQLEGQSIPGGWLWEDIGNYYGTGASALTYSDNYYTLHLSSSNVPGERVSISQITPFVDSLKLINRVVCSAINKDMTSIYGAPGSSNQFIEGSIPCGQADFTVKAAMPEPAKIAAAEFMRVLKGKGIVISGKISIESLPRDSILIIIADKRSPQLKDLIVPLNQESINLYAEHLLREVGRKQRGSSSLAQSLNALKEFCAQREIYTDGFYPTDGSGLSRSNGICTRTLAEMVRSAYRGVNRDYFVKSLSVAGVSGTLKSAYKGSVLENNLHAKTGSMSRVRSLSGIFTNEFGGKIIFAIIANNFESSQPEMARSIQGLLEQLYHFQAPNGDLK